MVIAEIHGDVRRDADGRAIAPFIEDVIKDDFASALFSSPNTGTQGRVALSGYCAAFFAAQRFFCASAIFRFVAALKPFRFFGRSASAASGISVLTTEGRVTADATGFFGGRPRRFAGAEPCNASIARLSLSRS